jgi:Family of unknown function (DUF5678)
MLGRRCVAGIGRARVADVKPIVLQSAMPAIEFQRKANGKTENTTFEHAKEVARALLPEYKRRLRQWLFEEEQRQNGCAADSAPQSTPDFEREQHWLSEHQREYVGQWVALDGDRLLSHGEDLNRVFNKAQAQGVKAPFTAFIEDPNQPWMGDR